MRNRKKLITSFSIFSLVMIGCGPKLSREGAINHVNNVMICMIPTTIEGDKIDNLILIRDSLLSKNENASDSIILNTIEQNINALRDTSQKSIRAIKNLSAVDGIVEYDNATIHYIESYVKEKQVRYSMIKFNQSTVGDFVFIKVAENSKKTMITALINFFSEYNINWKDIKADFKKIQANN